MILSGRNFFFTNIDVNREFETLGFTRTPDIVFPSTVTHVMISNESNEKTLYFSFNGSDTDGILFRKETPISFDGLAISRLHFAREQGGGVPIKIRVWGWRR